MRVRMDETYEIDGRQVRGSEFQAYLDGFYVWGCVEADDVEGYVKVADFNDHGKAKIVYDNLGMVHQCDKIMRGKVEIRRRSAA